MFQAFMRDTRAHQAQQAQLARRLLHSPRVCIDGCASQVRACALDCRLA